MDSTISDCIFSVHIQLLSEMISNSCIYIRTSHSTFTEKQTTSFYCLSVISLVQFISVRWWSMKMHGTKPNMCEICVCVIWNWKSNGNATAYGILTIETKFHCDVNKSHNFNWMDSYRIDVQQIHFHLISCHSPAISDDNSIHVLYAYGAVYVASII